VVCKTYQKNIPKLFVIDESDKIKVINKRWYLSNVGYIAKQIILNNDRKRLMLHNYIMNRMEFPGKGPLESIDHINRIKTDNRKENLRLISQSEQNINQGMRRSKLSNDCEIRSEDIPRYVRYCKNHGRYADRFCIDLHRNAELKLKRWYSSENKKLSLRFKLEQTKKYLRYLKQKYPIKFNKLCIEYEYFDDVLQSRKDYNAILKLSGYSCVKDNLVKINEKNYLVENLAGLSDEEKYILKNLDFDVKNKSNRSILSSLPHNCGVTKDMIPKYCYYSPTRGKHGDKFVIDRHPKINKRCWNTTSSKKISTKEKFDLLLVKLKEIEKAKLKEIE